MNRVFVYGTLNPLGPHYNQRLVEGELGITEWEEATTNGTRVPSGGAWDYVWFHEDGDPIQGVVLTLPNEACLRRLDRYEHYNPESDDNLFIRKEIALADGTTCFGYEWGRPREEEAWL